jgi:hypothetical protein
MYAAEHPRERLAQAVRLGALGELVEGHLPPHVVEVRA